MTSSHPVDSLPQFPYIKTYTSVGSAIMDEKDRAFLEQTKGYIDFHLTDEAFGVQALADCLKMDRSHMHRRLQQLKGMSASTWIRASRLTKAKDLLTTGKQTVAEVAYAVGFSSPQYFHKVFVREVGMTPGQFVTSSLIPSSPTLSSEAQPAHRRKETLRLPARFFRSMSPWSLAFAGLGLVMLLIWGWQQLSSSKAPQSPRIALIPFDSESTSPEQQYFADGMSTDILNRLSLVPEVDLMSNSSTEVFRDRTMSMAEIGRTLDVDFIISGKVQGGPENPHITVELVNTGNGKPIWSQAYDQNWTDLFAIQGDITLQIAEHLQASVSEAVKKYLDRKPTTVMSAYDFLLRARTAFEHHRYTWNERDLNAAISLYNEALKIDSSLAEAYVGLGEAFLGGEFYAGANYGNRNSVLDTVLTLSGTALELDPDSYDALILQGDALRAQGRNKASRGAYLRAADLRSNAPVTYEKLGLLATFDKAYDRALINRLRALELDPKNPKRYMDLMRSYRDLNDVSMAETLTDRALQLQPGYLYALEMKGVLALETGRLAEALEIFKKMYALNPKDLWAKQQLATVFAWLGDYAEAVNIFHEMHDIITGPGFQRTPFTPFRGQTYGWALWQLGKEEEARSLFESELEWDKMNSSKHFNLTGENTYKRQAAMLGFLGQKSEALDLLEKSIYSPGSPFTIGWLQNDPIFKPLRNEPRYHKMLAQYEEKLEEMRNNIVPWRARTQALLSNF